MYKTYLMLTCNEESNGANWTVSMAGRADSICEAGGKIFCNKKSLT